jgi:hypothetical protein
MGVTCTGCSKGVAMCYKRPCWGTPEEFSKLLDAGYAGLIQRDVYHGIGEGKHDIHVLTMAIYPEDMGLGDSELADMFSMMLSMIARATGEEKKYKSEHTGGRYAPLNPSGKCIMLTEDNLCGLHDLGLKPEQGREACCKRDQDTAKDNIHYSVLWDTDLGRSVVARWKELNHVTVS